MKRRVQTASLIHAVSTSHRKASNDVLFRGVKPRIIGDTGSPGTLHSVTANARGSGRSRLTDAASLIACGRTAARKTYSRDDEEMRKVITAVAREAIPRVAMDNIDTPLDGAARDGALTGTTGSDRILGSSRTTGERSLQTFWNATGNNLRFAGDAARRVLPIRLETPLENPENRSETEFEHPDLVGWVAEKGWPPMTPSTLASSLSR